MTIAQIERLLIEYSYIPERKRELDMIIKETKQLKENIEQSIGSFKITGLPRDKYIYHDRVLEAVQKIIDEYDIHLTYYRNQLELLNTAEKEMYEALKCLNKIEYNIVNFRYLKGYRWEVIAIKVSYSRPGCFKIRDKALQKICESYKSVD